VVEKQGLMGCVTWPTQGEFASQTTFALSASAPEFLQWTAVPGPVAAVAGFTDGVERLGLHLSGRTPAPGFFVPVFGRVRDKGPQAACEITTFLDSDRCRAESDDDKTLLVLISNHAE
jgi:hypothetical protein